MVNKKNFTVLLASSLISISGIVDANIHGPKPKPKPFERVVGKWKNMKITTKNCKARGYNGGRVKIKGAWYCFKENESKTYRPVRIGSKKKDVTTVVDGPVNCTGGPCNLASHESEEICHDIYVENMKGSATGLTTEFKDGVASVSVTAVFSKSELKGSGKRACKTDTISVQCFGANKEKIRIDHITRKNYFNSKISVKGYKLRQRRIGKSMVGSPSTTWTGYEYKVSKRKRAVVVGMLKMWLPVSTSTRCRQW